MFVAVIGLLIFLHYIKILKPVENIIITMLNPISSGIYSVSTDLRVVYNEQTDRRDLLNAIGVLEVKVRQLTAENSRLKVLEEENKVLRQHLKFLTKNEYNYILANVLYGGKDIMIDKGTKDGLGAGLAVVNSQGIIIGKIDEVKDSLAKVSLITSDTCRLAVAIGNQEKTIGVVEGELDLTIKMNFIPQTENVKVGNIVITSGLEKSIPRGLVIGEVVQVDKGNNEVWQSAIIEPVADLDELIIVSVLLP